MGCHPNIDHMKWPKQGKYLHQRMSVCFNYNPDNRIGGRMVRDDAEEPFVTIIALDDGRFILATECQYSPEL